jgi:hypothetical protein
MKEFIQRAWKSTDESRFPGPQPVSIERRHFGLLKLQPYMVCEKTDGTRNFLISTNEGVFLVDRAFHVTPVKIRIAKETLLDGELVTAKNGARLFIVHDAVLVKGVSLLECRLDERLDAARSVIKGIIKTSSAPFEVRVKTMGILGTSPVPDLNSFEYETDGLVFTPVNEPIRMGTHETMFKWKPRERITVDFEIKNGEDLYVQERGEPVFVSGLNLHNRQPDLPDGTIVECGYGQLGWFVEKVRTDKTYANNRRTFTRTCVNLQEAIKIEEFQGL